MTIDENSINNLLSGLVGAIIAVIWTSTIERIRVAQNINRIRITLIDYLTFVGLYKSIRYCEDIQYVKELILTTDEEKLQHTKGVDSMPTFTSDIFKSFAPAELRKTCYNSQNYIKALDIYYTIDFLKSNMPITIYTDYLKNIEEHFESKNILTFEEKIEHSKNCGLVKQKSNFATQDADIKLLRARQLNVDIQDLINDLSGNSVLWTMKYLCRF